MNYINQIINLSKANAQEPLKIQYKFLDSIDMYEDYLPDGKIWLPEMRYKNKPLLKVNTDTYEVLKLIFNSITSYPWVWELNGEKLDVYGYDMYINGNVLQFSPSALKAVQEHVGYEPENVLETIYSQPKFAYAPHLTKLSIELEKTSTISELSFQLHSIHPVKIAGIIYETTLSGEGQPMELNLEELDVQQSNQEIVILFGKPIVVKRLTITLAQNNLSEVIALTTGTQEDTLEQIQQMLLRYAGRLTNGE